MAAKVFISCGQASPEERDVAQSLAGWFTSQGYFPYVAIQVQSILDLNASIIGELKTSDYYLFINFKRDQLSNGYRGSLFTNQELAIAYALGFEHMLLLNQHGVKREGVFGFMVSNIPEFSDYPEVLPSVQNAVSTANWSPDYTRHLSVAGHHFTSKPFNNIDHTGSRNIRALHVRIRNSRIDLGAVGSILRLFAVTNPSNKHFESTDRSQLKASGHPGYSQTIWPNSEAMYDLLAIDMNNQDHVYLLSERDVHPRLPIIDVPGRWLLDYELFSQGFPRLAFRVILELTGRHDTTNASIEML